MIPDSACKRLSHAFMRQNPHVTNSTKQGQKQITAIAVSYNTLITKLK
jgi:hypothetical protein